MTGFTFLIGNTEFDFDVESHVTFTGSGNYADDPIESEVEIEGIYFGDGRKVSPSFCNFLSPYMDEIEEGCADHAWDNR